MIISDYDGAAGQYETGWKWEFAMHNDEFARVWRWLVLGVTFVLGDQSADMMEAHSSDGIVLKVQMA